MSALDHPAETQTHTGEMAVICNGERFRPLGHSGLLLGFVMNDRTKMYYIVHLIILIYTDKHPIFVLQHILKTKITQKVTVLANVLLGRNFCILSLI